MTVSQASGAPAEQGGPASLGELLHSIPRYRVVDIAISGVNMGLMISLIDAAIRERAKLRACFCTAHTAVESHDNAALREAVNGSQVACPDGMPMVLLSRLQGGKQVERVYGPDILLACCEAGLDKGYRHFFYGSTEETLSALTSRLRARLPGLEIAGSYSPPYRDLTPGEDDAVITLINEARPDVVWVGLGMPKQELWSAAHQAKLEVPVVLPVGAAFDFHSGQVQQAPRWLQRRGAEWAYRLWREPRRLWRRYLLGNPRFLFLLLTHALGGHH